MSVHVRCGWSCVALRAGLGVFRNSLMVGLVCGFALNGCGPGPHAEGKALANDACVASKSADDPVKLAASLTEHKEKATKLAEKYVSNPDNLALFQQGYAEGTAECLKAVIGPK